MNCKKCRYCIQVARNKYEVKCEHDKVSADPNIWVQEPEYCKYYIKKGSRLDYNLDCLLYLKDLNEFNKDLNKLKEPPTKLKETYENT